MILKLVAMWEVGQANPTALPLASPDLETCKNWCSKFPAHSDVSKGILYRICAMWLKEL